MPETTAPARMAHLKRLIQFVSGHAERAHFPVHRIREIELALEEILVNIFSYAYPDATGDVTVTCRVEDGPRLILEIFDTGIPFNILDVPDPNLTAGIHERQIGGLGVYFIKMMADEAWYRREGDRNVLGLIFGRHRKGAVKKERVGGVQE